MNYDLQQRPWWNYLEEGMRELLKTSVLLIEKVPAWPEKFHDYSFIVFPTAKAYEGFLKKLFLDLGFITTEDYYGKRFRIGKALNPSLEKKYRHESVYDKLVDYCSGEDLAEDLWQAWKVSRNLLVHWFANEKNAIDFSQARQRVELVLLAMDKASSACKLNHGKS